MTHRTLSCSMCIATTLTLCALTTSAVAQPNPFDAYEGKRQTEESQRASEQASRGPDTSTDADAQAGTTQQPFRSAPLTLQGNWVTGASGALSFTTSSNETGAETVRNSTLFIRVSPYVGYFVLDRLEVGASFGVLWRQIARSSDNSALGREALIMARGRYHLPVTDRFSVLPGLGLGAYFGRSTRESDRMNAMTGQLINEQTRTFGGAGEVTVDIGYLLTPKLELQGGLSFVGLLGAERVQSEDDSFRVSTFNTSMGLGVAYYF